MWNIRIWISEARAATAAANLSLSSPAQPLEVCYALADRKSWRLSVDYMQMFVTCNTCNVTCNTCNKFLVYICKEYFSGTLFCWSTYTVSSGRGGSGVGGREMARRQDREKIDHQWLLLTIKIETTYPWDYNREDWVWRRKHVSQSLEPRISPVPAMVILSLSDF